MKTDLLTLCRMIQLVNNTKSPAVKEYARKEGKKALLCWVMLARI